MSLLRPDIVGRRLIHEVSNHVLGNPDTTLQSIVQRAHRIPGFPFIDKRYAITPLIQEFSELLNEYPEKDIAQQMHELNNRLNVDFQWKGESSQVRMQKGIPALSPYSHTRGIEPFFIPFGMERPDYTFLIANHFRILGPQFDDRFRYVMFLPQQGETVRLFGNEFNREQAIQHNQHAYEQAKTDIENGQMHFVAPTGKISPKNSWKSINRIFGTLTPEIQKEVMIVPLCFGGNATMGKCFRNAVKNIHGQQTETLTLTCIPGTPYRGAEIIKELEEHPIQDNRKRLKAIAEIMQQRFLSDPAYK